MSRAVVPLIVALTATCTAEQSSDLPLAAANDPLPVQGISLLGDTLRPPPLDSATRQDRQRRLAAAREAFERHPENVDSLIWYGRRLAYLGRYRAAIDVYSWGIERFPTDARLFRHRGHRYITIRDFARAMEDLLRATQLTVDAPDRVEPDGLPNARGIPTSTLKTNIWYHLGLTHYLRGDFRRAASAYSECLRHATNPDMEVAARYWITLSLRQLGEEARAAEVIRPVTHDMDVIENHAYHQLLLMYKGEVAPDALLDTAQDGDALASATTGYGVAAWYLTTGEMDRAMSLMRRILDGPQWPAFGFIAAEADVARLPVEDGTDD
jgi:tetratricopeptide (TPR) repeat protein